ncbi:hypothetical protein BOTCAL_0182g00190 [Botryotinia calthae]|uniref:Uncharacterized protein n=1 Tax=Botryotinia calthae TaxID=38488 RepID=A0A4Y8D0F2_9HELO|nr:hypothetical protein BOTCAL_0182g00190 [Botryotinia calthae]
MNDIEEWEFVLFLIEDCKTGAWPSLKAKEDFERKNRLEAEARGQQIRELTIELEQLVRQRRRMAIIREERQRRQRS